MDTNKQPGSTAAVVLAAGMSRRMAAAGPKQLLRIAGKPLLVHALESIHTAGISEIVLILGAEAEAIQQQIAMHGARVVLNPDYRQGMGTSLRAGLAAVSSAAGAALIILADQPFVRPETLHRLIAFHEQSSHERSGAQIILPLYRGFRGNPVLLDRSVFPEVMGLSGDVGCRAIFGSHTEGIHKLEVDDPGILLDIDTEDDLGRASEIRPQLPLPMLEERPADVPQNVRHLAIVGRDEVSRALARLARVLHFSITFVDPFLSLRELPEADRVLHALDFSLLPARDKAVVVASRGQFDEEAVQQALISNASNVALLANRKRAREVLNSLRMRGISEEKLKAVRAPAGIEIGAETPEEIALSILAEIIFCRGKMQPLG